MYMLKMKIIFCMRGYLHSHLHVHVHVHCKESERACGLDRRKEKSAIIKDPTSDLRYNSAPPPPPRFIHLPPPMRARGCVDSGGTKARIVEVQMVEARVVKVQIVEARIVEAQVEEVRALKARKVEAQMVEARIVDARVD